MFHAWLDFLFVSVPVRTASDQPYRIKKFSSRLFYGSDIRQPNLEVTFEMRCLVLVKVSWTALHGAFSFWISDTKEFS